MGYMPLTNGNPFPNRQIPEKTRDFFARFWYDRLWQIAIKKVDLENVPDTINKDVVIWTLFRQGFINGGKDDRGDLRIYSGTFYNFDGYGFPTKVRLIPYHPTEKAGRGFVRTVGKDGAWIRLTPNASSIVRTISTFAQQLAEIDIDLNVNLENLKMARIFVADDADQANKIRRLVDDLTTGNPAVLVDDGLGKLILKGQDNRVPVYTTPSDYIVDKLINDKRQVINEYLTAIGVDSSGANAIKAERNLVSEVQSNNEEISLNHHYWTDTLIEDFEHFNRIFNTEIKVVCKTKIEEMEENENDSIESFNEQTVGTD